MPSVRIFNALVLLKYKPNKLFTLILFSLFLSACSGGGSGSEDSSVVNKSSVAVRQANIIAGSLCPNGGSEINTGIDSNQNGLLDDDEISNTENVCHGVDGSISLIEIVDETAGEQCSYGGIRFNTGVDANSDGSLSGLEVTQSQIICHAIDSSGGNTSAALSDKAVITGNINVNSFTPQVKVGVQSNNINSRSILSRSMQSRAIKQSSGELKLVPGDITAAIQQHQQDPNAEQPVPVVPAGSDYSLVLINNDGTKGIKLEDIAVGAGETVTHDINDTDLLATGEIRFNVASLASGIALGNVEVNLLDLGTSTTTESELC